MVLVLTLIHPQSWNSYEYGESEDKHTEFPFDILNNLLESVQPYLLVYVHKHKHFGFYPHVYSATVLPYAIAFSILLFYHLGHIL
jgi:hypothetical protein